MSAPVRSFWRGCGVDLFATCLTVVGMGILTAFPAVPAEASAPFCSGIWMDHDAALTKMVDAFVELRDEVQKLPSGRDKALALQDLKSKLRELSRIAGPRLPELLEEAPNRSRDAAEKDALKNRTLETQSEEIRRFTRIQKHPEVRAESSQDVVFLDDDRLVTIDSEAVTVGQLQATISTYHFRTKKVIAREVPPIPIEGFGRLLLSPSKDFLIVFGDRKVARKDLQTGVWTSADLPNQEKFRVGKISKNGEMLYLGSDNGSLAILRLPDFSVLHHSERSKGQMNPDGIAESPDQRYVFFAKSGSSLLYDLQEKKPVEIKDLSRSGLQSIRSVAFFPDSDRMILAGRDESVGYSISRDEFFALPFRARGSKLSTSADGRFLLLVGDRPDMKTGAVSIVDLKSEKDLSLEGVDHHPFAYGARMHSEKSIVSMRTAKVDNQLNKTEERIHILDLETGQNRAAEINPGLKTYDIFGLSPDGNSIWLVDQLSTLLEVY